MTKPIIELIGASLLVDNRLLFRQTTWAIRRGEHWALTGPNGAGKTLLASALTGAAPVVRGELRGALDAVVQVSFEQQKSLAGDAPAAARWFSLEQEDAPAVYQYLSQDSIEERNPFEVVQRRPAAARAFAQRRLQVVKLLGISRRLQQSVPSLSNGEMRKLLLARALLRQPRLLILDDPFTGMDEAFRRQLKTILETLIRRDSTRLLLIATHPDELPRGITHWLRVDRCRVIAQGRFVRSRVRELFCSTAPKPPKRLLTRKPHCVGPELVRLSNVTVRYGRRTILENINWIVRRGESWALLGPNGSGKSTLLSLIIGDNPQAYANDVRVFGHRRGDGKSIWALKRRIGWVAPELHLHFPTSATCLETVASGFLGTAGCFRSPTPRQCAAARRCLAQFSLTAYADRTLSSLSVGLQRMTLLARAVVKNPDLLVLDEPCQGLDIVHRERFNRIVEGLLRHTTVIYVTHRRDEIPTVIDRVLRLTGA